jgi:hypothetical protein
VPRLMDREIKSLEIILETRHYFVRLGCQKPFKEFGVDQQ